MDILTTLLQLLLAVFGVDLGGSRHVHHDRVDGVDILYSIATVESGIARFECLASASGRCYYTVFPASCATTPSLAGTLVARCRGRAPRQFEVPTGGERKIPGIAVADLCVRGDAAPVAHGCEVPAGRPGA